MPKKAKKVPRKKAVARSTKVTKPKPKPKEKRKMTDKDKARQEQDKRDHDEKQRRDNHIDNRDQDPKHPANNTPASQSKSAPRPEAETFGLPPADLLTEQEKDAVGAAGDPTAGVGPAGASEHTSGPVETIEDQGIGPRTPYPVGDPPPAAENTSRSQGIKGLTDQPGENPSESHGAVGKTRLNDPGHDTHRKTEPKKEDPAHRRSTGL